MNLIRTTRYAKLYNSSDHVNTEQGAALFEAVAEKHGERSDRGRRPLVLPRFF
jgi:hypothetical protein